MTIYLSSTPLTHPPTPFAFPPVLSRNSCSRQEADAFNCIFTLCLFFSLIKLKMILFFLKLLWAENFNECYLVHSLPLELSRWRPSRDAETRAKLPAQDAPK